MSSKRKKSNKSNEKPSTNVSNVTTASTPKPSKVTATASSFPFAFKLIGHVVTMVIFIFLSFRGWHIATASLSSITGIMSLMVLVVSVYTAAIPPQTISKMVYIVLYTVYTHKYHL